MSILLQINSEVLVVSAILQADSMSCRLSGTIGCLSTSDVLQAETLLSCTILFVWTLKFIVSAVVVLQTTWGGASRIVLIFAAAPLIISAVPISSIVLLVSLGEFLTVGA